MQPQTPPPAPPPVPPTPSNGQNPYAFLFEDKKKPKKALLPKPGSGKQRIIYVVAGVITLMIVGTLLMSFLSSASNQNITDLKTVAQQQTEIIRVTAIASSKAKDSKTQNLALTTSMSLTASQLDILDILKNSGNKMSQKDLGLTKNTQTDTLLTQADQANNFDKVFLSELAKELTDYQASVKKAFDSSSNKSNRAKLQQAYNNASELLKETQ